MRTVVARLRQDPGLAVLVLALVAAAGVYAPTLGFDLVNHDDPWLVADNWVVQSASWASLHTIWFDLDSPRRMVLSPEYLPIRDLSMMLDFAVWGRWWHGFHLTNVLLYGTALVVWFRALDAFGVERRVAGLAILLWAVHPSHAESVAWITERKGLLAMVWAGGCAFAYARYRAGGRAAWLVLAALAALCAVWSKAHGAFAVAAIAGLEVVLPARRARGPAACLAGLGVIGLVGVLAFVPVVLLAVRADVIGEAGQAPASRVAMVLGVHGFYLRSGAMALRNAVSYPIGTLGPSVFELVLGGIGLAGVVALLVAPLRAAMPERAAVRAMLRAGAVIWVAGWLPVSHLLVPLEMVVVADRYLLVPSLGLALVVAVGLSRIGKPGLRRAAIAVILLAGVARSLDAASSWRGPEPLWSRAVASNPADGNAWAMYLEAVAARAPGSDEAARVLEQALAQSRAPRLLARAAMLVVGADRGRGRALMREAAAGGDGQAMSNLALLLLESGDQTLALDWARQGAALRPRQAHAHRTLGKVALAIGDAVTAHPAFVRALALEPGSCTNELNVGLALVALRRAAEALPHFEACVDDPQLGGRARAERTRALVR